MNVIVDPSLQEVRRKIIERSAEDWQNYYRDNWVNEASGLK